MRSLKQKPVTKPGTNNYSIYCKTISVMKIYFSLLFIISTACSFNTEHSNKANSNEKRAVTENEAQMIVYALPKYEVDELLWPVLDEIIKDQNSCDTSAIRNTGFALTIKYYDSFTDLYFSDVDLDYMSPGKETGCFIHSDKVFLFRIPQSGNILFSPLNDTLKISSDYVPIEQEIPIIDDSGSTWLYRVENKRIQMLMKSLCK